MLFTKSVIASIFALLCISSACPEHDQSAQDLYVREPYHETHPSYLPDQTLDRRDPWLQPDQDSAAINRREIPLSTYKFRRHSYPITYERDIPLDIPLAYLSHLTKRAPDLELHVCFGKRRKPDQAIHWLLAARPEGSNTATWYHVTGGPTQNKPFKLEIQAGKAFNSPGIAETHHIGNIPAKDINKVKASAQSTPLPGPGKNCQDYLVGTLDSLEGKKLVPAGTAAHYRGLIERAKTPPAESSTDTVIEGTS